MAIENPSNAREALFQAAAEELGPEALEAIDPETSPRQDPTPTDGTPPFIPECMTQESAPENLGNDPTAIMIRWKDNIPRWKPGSVIRFTGWRMGFHTQEDANHAWHHLNLAAKAWNQQNIGITFENVALAKDAKFAICYGGDRGDSTLASSFFPGNDMFYLLRVYRAAFAEGWRENLWKTLTHELGHIMGLRHEFIEPGLPSIRFGESNNLSVMDYTGVYPEIQPSDVASTREFYELENGAMIYGVPVKDFDPSVLDRPMVFT